MAHHINNVKNKNGYITNSLNIWLHEAMHDCTILTASYI